MYRVQNQNLAKLIPDPRSIARDTFFVPHEQCYDSTMDQGSGNTELHCCSGLLLRDNSRSVLIPDPTTQPVAYCNRIWDQF